MNSQAEDARFAAVRDALQRARDALPPSASHWAKEDPNNPGSVDTLRDFAELMEQVEYEVALYAVAGIARGSGAGTTSRQPRD